MIKKIDVSINLLKANPDQAMKSRSPLPRFWLTLFLAIVSITTDASAATIARSGLLEVSTVTGGLGSSFVWGDIFTYTIQVEDSVIDIDSDPGYAEFPNAVVSLTIAPVTTRAGIWTPAASFTGGSVYAEDGAVLSWSCDAYPGIGFGSQANGYDAVMLAMGFGGLPANGDTGGGQTLGQITGNLLNFVSPSATNSVELAFEQGIDSQLVTFNLTSFHAPEPGRSLLLLGGLSAGLLRRRRC